jgi:hypothetical protein
MVFISLSAILRTAGGHKPAFEPWTSALRFPGLNQTKPNQFKPPRQNRHSSQLRLSARIPVVGPGGIPEKTRQCPANSKLLKPNQTNSNHMENEPSTAIARCCMAWVDGADKKSALLPAAGSQTKSNQIKPITSGFTSVIPAIALKPEQPWSPAPAGRKTGTFPSVMLFWEAFPGPAVNRAEKLFPFARGSP